MDVQSFPRFPQLPLEIRNMIWGLAIWPRLVYIQEGRTLEGAGIQRLISRRYSTKVYLYSTSPVPSMLHVCRESRQAMEVHGYSLMFGTAAVGPRIWFNGQHDTVYIDVISGSMPRWSDFHGACNFYHQKATYDRSDTGVLTHASLADLARVRRIALLLRGPERFMLEPFHCLDEILLVQEHCSSMEYFTLADKRDNYADPWGYLDCDVSDALGYCLPHGIEVARGFEKRIRNHKISTKSWGRDFFAGLGKQAEDNFRNYQAYGTPRPAYILRNGVRIYQNSTIPKIRYVVVKTRTQASQLLAKRARYWHPADNEEAWDREGGPQPGHTFPLSTEDATRIAEEESGCLEVDYQKEEDQYINPW